MANLPRNQRPSAHRGLGIIELTSCKSLCHVFLGYFRFVRRLQVSWFFRILPAWQGILESSDLKTTIPPQNTTTYAEETPQSQHKPNCGPTSSRLLPLLLSNDLDFLSSGDMQAVSWKEKNHCHCKSWTEFCSSWELRRKEWHDTKRCETYPDSQSTMTAYYYHWFSSALWSL